MDIKENEIFSIKLNSGEELITRIKKVTPEYLIISEPVSVAPGPQGMGLVPSLFTADPDEKLRLNTASISLYALTDDPVKMKYIEATTGIKVPDKKIILG